MRGLANEQTTRSKLTRVAETINGLYKAEVTHKDGPWRGLEDVERATLTLFREQWVAWFNNRRRLHPIGDLPPAEFEKMYHQQTELSDVAWLR